MWLRALCCAVCCRLSASHPEFYDVVGGEAGDLAARCHDVRDRCTVACQRAHGLPAVALPHADCTLQAAARHHAKGARVREAVHASSVQRHAVKHLRALSVSDANHSVQRAAEKPHLHNWSHLPDWVARQGALLSSA